MNNKKLFYVIIIALGMISKVIAQPSFIWGKQFGTEQGEAGHDIVIYENGDFVLTGSTTGNLYSDNIGKRDVFIMKLDKNWNIDWERQFGSKSWDEVWKMDFINAENKILNSRT